MKGLLEKVVRREEVGEKYHPDDAPIKKRGVSPARLT